MSAVTSPIPAWNALMRRVPPTPLLAFLLVGLPLTVISFYILPYFDFAVPKLVWMIFLLLAVFLFQIRASMEHVSDRYLNALTSYPINFVALPTLYVGFMAFSSTVPPAQSFITAFLGLATLFYAVYALVHRRTESSFYKILTRPGSPLVQFLVAFALIMIAVWALPNPANAEFAARKHGLAASWQEQLAAAQAKVAERDSNAVLSRVTSYETYPLVNGYLSVNFYFVTDKPVLYIVTLQDWNPRGTAELKQWDADNVAPPPEARTADLSSLRAFLPYIKLNSRDVLQLTPPEILPGSGLFDTTWSADLTLNPVSQSLIPLWNVTHTNIKTGTYQTYNILADTGIILGSSSPK